MTTLMFMGLFSDTVKLNEKIGIENFELKEKITTLESDLKTNTEDLAECDHELYEYQKYIGDYELKKRKEFYTQPALDWDKIATSTEK